MKRLDELKPLFIKYIPVLKEHGIPYISEEFEVSVHLCACGCGGVTVQPFNDKFDGWDITIENDMVSFTPSVGNFSGENPYHVHYYIKNNMGIKKTHRFLYRFYHW
jgi:hypothetical protein